MYFVFFFNDTATTEIYTLSLHDALPICDLLAFNSPVSHIGIYIGGGKMIEAPRTGLDVRVIDVYETPTADRKSTRLNSSHANISYAVFCLKKKKKKKKNNYIRQDIA